MEEDGHVRKRQKTESQEETSEPWAPNSWRAKPIKQQPEYKDEEKLTAVLDKVKKLPPLVHPGEIDQLRTYLGEASEGKRFLLQGGDCAEIFQYCNTVDIENKLKVLLQMSLVLTYGARTPVVRIARMAGQYAKPRSSNTELVDGEEVLSYRGDHVNGFDKNDREADPDRLLQAYFHSSATLNYVRALVNGGFADLRHPDNWKMDHVKNLHTRQQYEDTVTRMLDALDFMKTIDPHLSSDSMRSVDIFTSHEGLLLNYEEALTRKIGNQYYNVSAHFLWIGDRTRELGGAHIEYFRGLANPVGIKVGPSMAPEELVRVLRILNPDNVPGKVTLITRYGAKLVQQHLPGHIRAVKNAGLKVVWCCDPMHGNTSKSSSGLKTRNFDSILEELRHCFSTHKEHGSRLNGVHFELTGDAVTECTGGSAKLSEDDLVKNYKTFCDPRLNHKQSMDMAFLIANYYQKERKQMSTL
eukprot:Colp12_sorted_trinity150504_noHs@2351